MTTKAKSSHGTLLQMGDGVTPTEGFATVAEVGDITGPGLTLNTEEATSHDSPEAWAEFIGTTKDGGEVSFDINWAPGDTSHTGLVTALENKTLTNFKVVFPVTPAVNWSFAALVTGFEPGAPVSGKLTASVTLKVSGKPTLA